MTTNQNSTEVLREEILAEARKRAEEIIMQARQDAETFVANATVEADRLLKDRIDQARREAAQQSELILATVPVEAGRSRAAHVEALLESVLEEASQRLLSRERFEYREAVIFLACHAMSLMVGSDFVVKLTESDQTLLGKGLADEMARGVGRPVTISISQEPGMIGGGVIVEDAEARQVWDNSFVKRLERLWPELRRQIAVELAFVPAHISAGVVK